MKYLLVFLLLQITSSISLGAEAPSSNVLRDELQNQLVILGVVGTTGSLFVEGNQSGNLISCGIEFQTVFEDFAYQNGQLNVTSGSFNLMMNAEDVFFITMKLGIRPLQGSISVFEPPEFAYIAAPFGSTAKMKQVVLNGEAGFKLFAYQPDDPQFVDLLSALMEQSEIKVGFNRKKDGLDQVFSIETDVIDTTVDEKTGAFIRKRSSQTSIDFSKCVVSLLSDKQAP